MVDGAAAELEYDSVPTHDDVYDLLYNKFQPSAHVPFYVKDAGGSTTTLRYYVWAVTTPFELYNYGKSTYDVTWGWSGKGTMVLKEKVTVENSPENVTYDGEDHKWSPEVKASVNPNFSASDYTVTYYRDGVQTNDFKSAGTITVKIQGVNNGKDDYSYFSAEKDYTISQAKATVTADAASKTYGEADPTFTAKVTGMVNGESSDLIHYTVARTNTDENASTYKGVIEPKGEASQGNYSVEYVSADFTIDKAKVDVTVTGNSDTVTYDGKPHTVSGFKASCENPLYDSESNVELAQAAKGTDTVSGTNADEYYMGLTKDSFVNKNNNFDVKFIVIDGWLSITKADTLKLSADSQEYTYDGKSHSEAAVPSDTNGTMVEYSTDGKKTWTTTAPTVKDVADGKVEVTARAISGNYENIPEVTFTIEVKQAQVTVTADAASKTYGEDDPAFTAQVEGVVSGESAADLIKYTVDRMNIDEDAGLYEYVIFPEGKASQGNYTVEYVPANFIINRAEDLSLDVSNAGYKGTYDGQEHGGAAVTNDPYNTAKIEYCTGDPDVEDNWSTDVPKVKDVADVTVKVRATSDNYTAPAYAEYALEVTPAQVTVSVKGKTDTVTYDGTEHSVSGFEMTGISGEATEYYSPKSIVLVGGNEAKATNASTTYMGLEAADFDNSDTNYKVTFNVESDGWLKIDPADVAVNVKGNISTVTYNGEKQQVTGFTATTDSELYDTGDVVLNPDFSDIAVGTDAATYMMGLGADSFFNTNDNFNVNWNFEGDGGITIEKRAIQVSDSASVVYNGQEQVLDIDASKVTNLVDGDRLYLFGAQVKGTEPGTYADVADYTWDVVNDELNVTNNYDLTVAGELTIAKADSGSNGSSADNGANASDSASGDGSSTTKTGDTALPFGVAAAAAAAALAAFAATRKLRSMKR